MASTTSKSNLSAPKKRGSKKPNSPHNKLTEEQKKIVDEAFELFSEDKKVLNATQLSNTLVALGIPCNQSIASKIIEKESNSMLKKLPVPVITIEQFYEHMSKEFALAASRAELIRAFKYFDKENQGFITFQNLRSIYRDIGETKSENDMLEMIEAADPAGNGFVTQEEFLMLMLGDD